MPRKIIGLCSLLLAVLLICAGVRPARAGLFDSDAEELYQEGIKQLEAGDLEQAEASFFGAIDEDPNVEGAYYQLGLLNMKKQKYDFAARLFRNEWNHSEHAESLYQEAICYTKLGLYNQAIDILTEAEAAYGGDLKSKKLLEDPEFEPLRDKGAFKKLIDSMKWKEKGTLEYLSETLTEIKLVIISLRRVLDFSLELVKLVGFKVLALMMAVFILAVGLNVSGLTSGKTGFFVALVAVFGFYYYFTRVFSAGHTADLRTILETFGWLMLPLAALYLFSRLASRLLGGLSRRLALSGPSRAAGAFFLPTEKADEKSLRRALYKFDDLAEQYIRESFDYLNAAADSEERRDAQMRREITRDKLVRLLGKAAAAGKPDRKKPAAAPSETAEHPETGEFTMD